MQGYKSRSITLVHGVLTKDAIAKIKGNIFICEGRPSLESGKSNTKGFLARKITPTVICDNMVGFLFFKGFVKKVVLACQYADKGGALCDTGALIYAVLAKRHKVTVKLVQGKIKMRFLGDPKDILKFENTQIAPKGTKGYAPLVEWVPGKYLK